MRPAPIVSEIFEWEMGKTATTANSTLSDGSTDTENKAECA
jgi:hypothetical protein